MNKILYIILLLFVVSNCSVKPVVKHHGVPSLDKKKEIIYENVTNKNEILSILGSPSVTSKFDNDVWIYIERKQTQSKLVRLGKMKISKNDILILEIDDYGILKKKKLLYKRKYGKYQNINSNYRDWFQKKLIYIRFHVKYETKNG